MTLVLFEKLFIGSILAKSSYVVKQDGKPSNEYWMSLMRDWLISLQKELDKVLDQGLISRENGSLLVEDLEFKKLLPKINNVAMLARRLVCSVGNEYNCTRVGVWSYLVC